MYRSPLLDSACPVCKRGENVYDYDYVLRHAETLAFTNDTFYKRLHLRFDYGWTNRKSRTLLPSLPVGIPYILISPVVRHIVIKNFITGVIQPGLNQSTAAFAAAARGRIRTHHLPVLN